MCVGVCTCIGIGECIGESGDVKLFVLASDTPDPPRAEAWLPAQFDDLYET